MNVKTTSVARPKVDKNNPNQIGASMQGPIVKILVYKGNKVKKGVHLMITEAMKMEMATTVQAAFDSEVKEVYVKDGDAIQVGALLIELF